MDGLTVDSLLAKIGVQIPAEIAESSVSEFQQFLSVNVFGMFLAVRAETRAMKNQDAKLVSQSNPRRGKVRGVIINMGSCSSYCATPHLGQYTASKHAVLGLTRNAGMTYISINRALLIQAILSLRLCSI